MRTFEFAHPQETVVVGGKRYRISRSNPVYPAQATKKHAENLAKMLKTHGYGAGREKLDTIVVPFTLTGMSTGSTKVWLVYERKVK